MDEQLCMLGFGVSLPEKEKKAILTLQTYEKAKDKTPAPALSPYHANES